MQKKTDTLKTLEKISSSSIDELRSLVAQIERKQEELLEKKKSLMLSEERERELLSQDPLSGVTYTAFLDNIQGQQQTIQQDYSFLEEEKERLMDNIKTHFQDQKKWEIMLTKENERLNEEEKKQEQKILDQLAEQRHASRDSTFFK